MSTERPSEDAARKSLWRAIRRSLLGKYSLYAVNAISTIVLARFFAPEAFGIVAIGMVLFTFTQLLAEAGIGPAIINLRHLEPEDRDGIFSFLLVLGLALGVLLFVSAGPIAAFFGEEQITITVRMIAPVVLFQAAASLPVALLLREQKFLHISAAGITGELISTAATILLSHRFDPVTSLSAKMPIMSFCQLTIAWILSGKTEFGRTGFGTKFSAIAAIARSSSAQFGFNFVNFFSRNLDSILVGKFLGFEALGFYNRSYQLMRYPLLLLSFSLVPAIQPVLRGYVSDPLEVERINRELSWKLGALGCAAGLVIWIGADVIVRILLGPGWEPSARLLEIFAISIPCQVIAATSGGFYQAFNRMGLLFMTGLITSFINVAGMFVGALSGNLETLCWWIVGSFSVSFCANYFILYRFVLALPVAKFVRSSGLLAIGFVVIMSAVDVLIRQ
ncbi:oligosaccharide flippase family protein [Frigidibacter sp.]|uniref:oligosaccharide flippase family protein n=1 Tax=Frigidibacter sp. TaxID=2586418 RepID=UPI0027368776|nr:oligosaccharide flippase family protein [Frigidibacter sp.]MDP3342375.1 oligosaccharide flippase family protein [Frigidibacter sp.]